MSAQSTTKPQTLQADDRTLEYYDARGPGTDLVVFYHHGTPNIGEPPVPLLAASAARGIGWVSLSRPGYGASTRREGRTVAQVADDVRQVADAVGVESFAVLGFSGGGPHALACAAVLPERVSAVVSIAGLAPLSQRRLEFAEGEGEPGLTARDVEMLGGVWEWLDHGKQLLKDGEPDGLLDDDASAVAPWGFELAQVKAPTLLVHGAADRIVPVAHCEWLGQHLPHVERWIEPDEGHFSVMRRAEDALDWMVGAVARG